uniref:Timeless N-terminal domain-containing protein n=1 Tax=Panagrolaimus superbus TaxID=310955 RepID=A0A914YWP4_9BILA
MADALIQATISRLGYTEDGVYYREPDCFDGLRDLIRFLHNDDRDMLVRRTCASHNILKHDLVLIMKDEESPEELFDAALRLAVNLCQPTAMVLESQRLEEDEKKITVYCELETGLLRSLPAFADPLLFKVLAAKLKNFFDLSIDDRAEKKKVLIERIIVLLRYIFAIGYDSAKYAQVQEVDYRVQESVISTFLKSAIPDIIFSVVCTKREREFSLHFLSIFALSVKPFNGTKVAAVGETTERILQEQEKDERRKRISSSLSHLVATTKPHPPSGRSFLGGMYEMKGLNAINKDRTFIVSKALVENKPMEAISNRKTAVRVAKNKKITNFTENSLGTGPDASGMTLLVLKEFTIQFIGVCYNRLMKQSKDQAFLSNLSLTHKYSEIYFFVVVEYVMEFARIAKISYEKVSQTFCKEFFHFVLAQVQTYFELMKTDKASAKMYALKAQHAISAYKQMILYLNYLDTDPSDEAKECYNSICHYIFELEEYRELGYIIMSAVSPSSSTRKLLEDLVIMNHYYLHIMEREVKRGELRKVTKKKRKSTKRKNKEKKNGNEEENQEEDFDDIPSEQMQAIAFLKKYDEDELNDIWETISSDLSDIIFNVNLAETVSVVDYLLGATDEDSQGFTFLKIQCALRERRLQDAYNIFHSARIIWNDGTFGSDDMVAEEEFLEFQGIFYAELYEFAEKYKQAVDKLYGEKENQGDEEEENAVAEFNELDEDDQQHVLSEIQFNMDEYLSNYARQDIISWYIFLLKDYNINSLELNKALLKLFHRIAFDLKSPSRLYSASFFRVLTRLHAELGKLPKAQQKTHIHFDFYRFGHHLLTQFFNHYKERGNMLINEVVLPKTAKECYEIENGYGTHDGTRGNKAILWPEELEEEIKSLHREYTDFEDKPEGMDVYDFIRANLSRERTRAQILKKVKKLFL